MISKEVELYTDKKEVFSDAPLPLDLTILYNLHGTAEHAERTMEGVEPNSIVFVEAFSTKKEKTSQEVVMDIINTAHMQDGIDSEHYKKLKSILLANITDELSRSVVRDGKDFTAHNLTLLKLCLEKDCLIWIADYKYSADAASMSERDDLEQKYTEIVRQVAAREAGQSFMDIDPTSPKYRHIGLGYDFVENDAAIHATREVATRTAVMETVRMLSAANDAKDVNRDKDGNFKCYLTYGIAHNRPLTALFQEEAIDPTVVMLANIDEWVYTATDSERAKANMARKVAFGAIYNLITEYAQDMQEATPLINEAYDALEYLNANEVETLRFFVHCLEIRQRKATDPTEARLRFLSLMREFMPEPQRFVERRFAVEPTE